MIKTLKICSKNFLNDFKELNLKLTENIKSQFFKSNEISFDHNVNLNELEFLQVLILREIKLAEVITFLHKINKSESLNDILKYSKLYVEFIQKFFI